MKISKVVIDVIERDTGSLKVIDERFEKLTCAKHCLEELEKILNAQIQTKTETKAETKTQTKK